MLVTKRSNALQRRKILAIFIGFFVFQLLFFPVDKNSFGLLAIPFFGTLGFFLTIITAHTVNFLAFGIQSDKRKYYLKSAILISLVSAFSAMFRASFIDRFLLSALASFWWLISLYLSVLPKGNFGSFTEIFMIPLRLASSLPQSLSILIAEVSKYSFEGSKVSKSFSKLVFGLAVTIPAAVILLILLSSADPIFGHYVKKIFTFDLSISEVAIQVLWRIFFSVAAITILTIIVLTKIKNTFASPAASLDKQNAHLLSPYLMLTITLSVILIAFLGVQIKYLFTIASLSDLTAFGIPTFSEYVRRGFIELILATAIVYSVSGAGLVLYRSFRPGKTHLFFNSLLIILNLALTAMAYRRVYLYMMEHGLTHMRIYGLMILLIIVLFL